MVIRISEGEASFNSEIQNDPIDPENCTFQEEWFDFWDDEGKAQPDFSDPKFLFIGANDPSLGKNKKSDTSSIIALSRPSSHTPDSTTSSIQSGSNSRQNPERNRSIRKMNPSVSS